MAAPRDPGESQPRLQQELDEELGFIRRGNQVPLSSIEGGVSGAELPDLPPDPEHRRAHAGRARNRHRRDGLCERHR